MIETASPRDNESETSSRTRSAPLAVGYSLETWSTFSTSFFSYAGVWVWSLVFGLWPSHSRCRNYSIPKTKDQKPKALTLLTLDTPPARCPPSARHYKTHAR